MHLIDWYKRQIEILTNEVGKSFVDELLHKQFSWPLNNIANKTLDRILANSKNDSDLNDHELDTQDVNLHVPSFFFEKAPTTNDDLTSKHMLFLCDAEYL
ncbi:MAG: hypothetical protein PUP46_01680 [Endozoicomonas sp. (ex Botrylloides leachii)]|nr:hypothetical protein [Endozoicomonas sp. (ex Botrylloides leachii)]